MNGEDLKWCSNCKNKQLENTLFKENTRKDVVQRLCITCTKQNGNTCKEQENDYGRQKRITDFNLKLICKIRTRTKKNIQISKFYEN